jgi:hypothetical protein
LVSRHVGNKILVNITRRCAKTNGSFVSVDHPA